MYERRPTRIGVGIGVFGIVFTFLTTALLVFVPQELLTPAVSRAYVETWSRPIMAVGKAVAVYGIPLLSAIFAYHLTTSYSAKSVVIGFVVGGIVLGLGDALLGVTVAHFFADDPAIGRSMAQHAYRIVTLGGRFVGGALAGTLCAIVVRERF